MQNMNDQSDGLEGMLNKRPIQLILVCLMLFASVTLIGLAILAALNIPPNVPVYLYFPMCVIGAYGCIRSIRCM
jgi:hypothetical protein